MSRFNCFRQHGGDDSCHHERRQARGDFWSHGDHGHGMGRQGRMGRLFAHGDLHYVILHLIAEKPRHGYEIIKAIGEMASGAYSPSPGTIYPSLTLLEEQGYVTSEAEASKKRYAITAEGQAYLDANRDAVQALLGRMERVGAARNPDAAPQVVRAVENLKLALRLRLARGPLDAAQAQTIAEILDRATGEIERS